MQLEVTHTTHTTHNPTLNSIKKKSTQQLKAAKNTIQLMQLNATKCISHNFCNSVVTTRQHNLKQRFDLTWHHLIKIHSNPIHLYPYFQMKEQIYVPRRSCHHLHHHCHCHLHPLSLSYCLALGRCEQQCCK